MTNSLDYLQSGQAVENVKLNREHVSQAESRFAECCCCIVVVQQRRGVRRNWVALKNGQTTDELASTTYTHYFRGPQHERVV